MAKNQEQGWARAKSTPPSVAAGFSVSADDDEINTPVRSGDQFDGGTDEDEDAGAGFGEGDDAKRVREHRDVNKPD